MLVWDDKTSHNKFCIEIGGVMQTHDEETRKLFRYSSVMCALSPRYARIFRARDLGSVKGFPKNSQEAQLQVMLYMEASCSKRHLLIRNCNLGKRSKKIDH
ncbi:phospholipase D10 [Canna indica]|uniref:Phospholipase D10 n=1 Tax=Canna indica TaxID=4628 RepID=A0AAQ3KY24_9LILI|nr:phospholipase D10 [Canna indica]